MNLNDFQKRLLWGLGILFILILWITFPLIFKEWVFTLLVKPPFTPEAFATLGPIGDIFGGLTAFFTSLTLIIVLYSAYLQRQANKDAREAMFEQLKQAKEASAEQLKQAKESTKQQLDLAEATRDAQIKESQNAIFTTKFNSLLNYKDEMLKTFVVRKDNKIYNGREIFDIYFKHFENLVDSDWKDLKEFKKANIVTEVRKCDKSFDEGIEFSDWYAHFLKIADLIKLIKNSELPDSEKDFFFSVLRTSMTMREQITLFWVAPVVPQIYPILEDSKIFNLFYAEKLIHYGKQFYKRGHFNSNSWKDVFDETENPA